MIPDALGLDAHPPGKLITCIVPDDDTDLRLMEALRRRHGVIMANSYHCRGISGPIKPGRVGKRLPPADSVRVVMVVVVEEAKADEIFEFMYEIAQSGTGEEGGMIYQGSLSHTTLFELPEGVEDEVSG